VKPFLCLQTASLNVRLTELSGFRYTQAMFIPFIAPSGVSNPAQDSRQGKIQAVLNTLNGPYNKRLWAPVERAEHQRNLNKLLSQTGQPRDMILKAPGSPAFIRWDQDGFSKADDLDSAKGYFSQDTQYIQNFILSDERGKLPRTVDSKVADNQKMAKYEYRFADEPRLRLIRDEALTPAGVRETFHIQNPDLVPHTLRMTVGTGFRDFFQVRAGADEKLASFKPRLSQGTSGFQNDRIQIEGTSAPFATSSQTPNQFSLTISTHGNIPIRQQGKLNASQDQAISQWLAEIPAQTDDASFTMDFSMRNALATTHSILETPLESTVKNKMALPSIRVDTSSDIAGQSIQHLQKMLAVSAQDLQMLTVPIPNPNPKNGLGTVFTPTAAGIPNFVTLFGRDSLLTALFTLQFQPEYAKQALLALAAYQGNKDDPATEEEPGKIMHELRQGELTRLGHTPHTPSYSTLDATPLFIILYDAYLQRTGDMALGGALRPNVRAALAWLERNTQGNRDGFLMQRDGQQQGGRTLKNIGWKDSQYSLRHRLQNGKLIDPPYPVAPVEVQAQVQQAWQAGARAFPEKSATYTARAAKMRQAFQEFWQPQQQWPASAMDAAGKPVASVASNGAQALWSDVFPTWQAQQIQERAQQPDLLSGWGMRTLSSNEAAYNPISYHNGTIWPQDNALIALGAKRNHCEALTQALCDQSLQAARVFPENRLPELYAGLPRHDLKGIQETGILEYPETCTVQAWASAAPYAFLTALLGLDIHQRKGKPEIHFDNLSLPSGVNRLEIKGVPVSLSGRSIDILAKRDLATQQINLWLRSSNPFTQWTPYKGRSQVV
jgi:glycogen debranching enzyme